MAFRELKKIIRRRLSAGNFDTTLNELAAMPARQVVNPLLGLLYEGEPLVRWRAVSAIGRIVARLADLDPESARVVVRRLMWNLNDESGGIGWGSPEAIGEILACHARMAHEYASILISYLDPAGNYLEHEGLQLGVLWAFGRLTRVRPELMTPVLPLVSAFLDSPIPELRGLALWAGVPLADERFRARSTELRCDPGQVTIYASGRLRRYSVSELANKVVEGYPGH